MYQLFSVPLRQAQGTLYNPNWKYVREGLKMNLSVTQRYYHEHSAAVPSQHFLLKLLYHFGADQGTPLGEYYQYLNSGSLNQATVLKMTSSSFTGKLFSNVFYGPGIREVLVAYDDAFDYYEAYQNWQTLQAVRVLSHPLSDTGMLILDGVNRSSATGVAVIAVNIPLLLVQYRAFRDAEAAYAEQGRARSAMQFIHMFVLPNMLGSHLDYALFNRFSNTYFALPQTTSNHRQPFYLTDWTQRVDALQSEMIKSLRERTYPFASMLDSIRTVQSPSMLEGARLPAVWPTRQINWAFALARLPVLELLFALNTATHGNPNRAAMAPVGRMVKLYEQEQAFDQVLPRALAQDVRARFRALAAQI